MSMERYRFDEDSPEWTGDSYGHLEISDMPEHGDIFVQSGGESEPDWSTLFLNVLAATRLRDWLTQWLEENQ